MSPGNVLAPNGACHLWLAFKYGSYSVFLAYPRNHQHSPKPTQSQSSPFQFDSKTSLPRPLTTAPEPIDMCWILYKICGGLRTRSVRDDPDMELGLRGGTTPKSRASRLRFWFGKMKSDVRKGNPSGGGMETVGSQSSFNSLNEPPFTMNSPPVIVARKTSLGSAVVKPGPYASSNADDENDTKGDDEEMDGEHGDGLSESSLNNESFRNNHTIDRADSKVFDDN
ncbi:hypothetical protein DL98DRAFT_584500 [Cadophora sp. DSE1049]|nr:hypothetical protein DL98DRAFT_584500 [Cadophora sp. DSE1049]